MTLPARRARTLIVAGLTAFVLLADTALLGGGIAAAQRGAGPVQGGPGAPGGARGTRAISGDPILVGAIDIHAHQGPDKTPRPVDFLDAARYAKLKGMRGMVFKVHNGSTVIQAFIARKEVPEFEAFGMLDLGWQVGGLNPAAVEYFASISMPGSPREGYGRVVMMGSDDTPMQLQTRGAGRPMHVAVNGQLVPEAKAVIAMVKEKNLSLTTGHYSAADALLLVKEALAQGMSPERISVTHANYVPAPAMSVQEMTQLAAQGVYVELSGSTQRAFTEEAQAALDARNDEIARAIRQLGADRVIMVTDVGQIGNEYHPDALAAFVRNMRARGISAADTDKMTKDNPAKFLGIPPPSQDAGSR